MAQLNTTVKKKRNNRLVWILGGVIVLLMAIAYYTQKNKKVGEKVAIEKATKRTIMETVSASGRIFPKKK